MRRIALAVALVLAGLAAGLVVSGRMRATTESDAAAVAQAVPAPRPRAELAAGGPDFTRVAELTTGAVTNIASLQVVRRQASPFSNDPFFQYFFGDADEMFGSRNRYESSLGSGVVISADGYVLTNSHVVGEGEVEVTVGMADKRELRAKVVGVDPSTDLALLKVEAHGLPTIPWGDSSKLKVAEWVMAIGNPFQLNSTVTLGIVSALGRANVGIAAYEDFIQTDAAINPGNSGGALINARGELIGINTAIYSQSGGYQGIGFAVPSNLARRVVDDLTKYGVVRRGSIGYFEAQPLTSRVASELRAPTSDGLVVTRIMRVSPAYEAGLRPGDVILSLNGNPITDAAAFTRTIADSPVGGTVTLEVLRDAQHRILKVPVQQEPPRQRPR
ncbi:MAG TPA: trypsin-like peptidase domain-containing protein [Vicinamibacterales bacterium]|nr:trypsin-like peptidase domain-containing protein [Vicinamibacterales bacterium]